MSNTPNSSTKETIESIYQCVYRSLSFVEAKNGSLVVFNTALLLGLADFFKEYCSYCHFWRTTFTAISIALLIISLGLSLWSFMPRKKSKNKKEKKKDNFIYSTEGLTNIGEKGLRDFLMKDEPDYSFTEADNAKIKDIMCTANSSSRKYKLFRCALRTAIFGIIAIFILLIINLYTY